MDGTHAFVSRPGIINDCHDQMVETFHGQGLDLFRHENGETYATLDHFGFIKARLPYITERERFYEHVIRSNNYAIDAGYATIGEQSPESNLRWNKQRIPNLVLLGNEAWGVTTGYVAAVVPNLDWAGGLLSSRGLGHSWQKMYGHQCLYVTIAGKLHMYRLCLFETGIQNMRANLQRINF